MHSVCIHSVCILTRSTFLSRLLYYLSPPEAKSLPVIVCVRSVINTSNVTSTVTCGVTKASSTSTVQSAIRGSWTATISRFICLNITQISNCRSDGCEFRVQCLYKRFKISLVCQKVRTQWNVENSAPLLGLLCSALHVHVHLSFFFTNLSLRFNW